MTTRTLFISGPNDALLSRLETALSGRVDLASVPYGLPGDEISGAAHGSPVVIIGPGAEAAHELIPGDGATQVVQFTGCAQSSEAVAALQSAGMSVANANAALAPFAADQTVELVESALTLSGHDTELEGLTVGIIGVGNVGIEVAKKLQESGARLIYHDIRTVRQGYAGLIEARRQTLDRVLLDSDVVTLHVSDTPQSTGMIGERELRLMKPGAVLVNTSLSGVIDENALQASLAREKPGAAALVTIESPPNGSPNPLTGNPRVLVKPWRATESGEALHAVAKLVAENITRFNAGQDVSGLMERVGFPGVGDPAFWSSHLPPRQAG